MTAKALLILFGLPKTKDNTSHALQLIKIEKLIKECIKGTYDVQMDDFPIGFGAYSNGRWSYKTGYEMDATKFTIKTITGGRYTFTIPKGNSFYNGILNILERQQKAIKVKIQ